MRDLSLGELLWLPSVLLTGCCMVVGILAWGTWFFIRYRFLRWLARELNRAADRSEALLEDLYQLSNESGQLHQEIQELCRHR